MSRAYWEFITFENGVQTHPVSRSLYDVLRHILKSCINRLTWCRNSIVGVIDIAVTSRSHFAIAYAYCIPVDPQRCRQLQSRLRLHCVYTRHRRLSLLVGKLLPWRPKGYHDNSLVELDAEIYCLSRHESNKALEVLPLLLSVSCYEYLCEQNYVLVHSTTSKI